MTYKEYKMHSDAYKVMTPLERHRRAQEVAKINDRLEHLEDTLKTSSGSLADYIHDEIIATMLELERLGDKQSWN